jgi:hypothetical protein
MDLPEAGASARRDLVRLIGNGADRSGGCRSDEEGVNVDRRGADLRKNVLL